MKMRCADEHGWPERDFVETPEGGDFTCSKCGWMQTSFAGGCRELVLSATWHNAELLASFVKEAGPITGTVMLEVTDA